jgi:hypothetical protein
LIQKGDANGKGLCSAEYMDFASYVFHHRERWGGKGCPGGLLRENIPICSRIIAVADAQFGPTIIRVFMHNILGAVQCA